MSKTTCMPLILRVMLLPWVLQRTCSLVELLKRIFWGNPDATDEEILEAACLAQQTAFVQTPSLINMKLILNSGNNRFWWPEAAPLYCTCASKTSKALTILMTLPALLIQRPILDSLRPQRLPWPDTVLKIIAQRTSSIEESDKIIVLDNGRINFHLGTHEETLSRQPPT